LISIKIYLAKVAKINAGIFYNKNIDFAALKHFVTNGLSKFWNKANYYLIFNLFARVYMCCSFIPPNQYIIFDYKVMMHFVRNILIDIVVEWISCSWNILVIQTITFFHAHLIDFDWLREKLNINFILTWFFYIYIKSYNIFRDKNWGKLIFYRNMLTHSNKKTMN